MPHMSAFRMNNFLIKVIFEIKKIEYINIFLVGINPPYISTKILYDLYNIIQKCILVNLMLKSITG